LQRVSSGWAPPSGSAPRRRGTWAPCLQNRWLQRQKAASC